MMMQPTLLPVAAVLQPCPCGNKHPVPGWSAQGAQTAHFVHCCDCGAWVEEPTETEAAAAWNVKARRAGRAA